MLNTTSIVELDGFLANHEAVAKPRALALGSVVGRWKVICYLGSGGTSEVHRVVRDNGTFGTIGTTRTDGRARLPSAPHPQQNEICVEESAGALKILLRDDAASRARFAQEVNLLKANSLPSFARYMDSGEMQGRPYLVTELLEPIDLPSDDAAVADYILRVCDAVASLHRQGLIHRDLKPSNIMRRSNGDVVLIDLGLVKDKVRSLGPENGVSLVSEKIVAVGTPRFAASEQIMGGEITAATDIHAIGRLADVAFGSNPPRCWLPIIRRATSSIPDQRYQSIEDLVHAIRHRNNKRYTILAASVVGLLAFLIGAVSLLWDATVKPQLAWSALCENVTTNLVVKELAWERLVTNKIGNLTMVLPGRAYRQVQKPSSGTIVSLKGQTNDFDRPLVLDASREYFVEGPGILAADIQAKGGTVRVHLKNCFLFNRSPVPIDKADIRYVFEGGAYLNFTALDEPPRSVINACIEEFDGAFDVIRFKGPMTRKELEREREATSRALLDLDAKTFFKNFRFPCRFLLSRWKYVVENMTDSIYNKYGIDPNRVPTDAEVELVAYCFDVDCEEAKSIISCRKYHFLSKVSPLDLRGDSNPKVKG